MSTISEKHSHYHKDVRHLASIDVYRVLQLFNVTDPCLQHAIKKLLVAGGRGGGKDITKDINEAIDSCQRALELRSEDGEQFGEVPMHEQEPQHHVQIAMKDGIVFDGVLDRVIFGMLAEQILPCIQPHPTGIGKL